MININPNIVVKRNGEQIDKKIFTITQSEK